MDARQMRTKADSLPSARTPDQNRTKADISHEIAAAPQLVKPFRYPVPKKKADKTGQPAV